MELDAMPFIYEIQAQISSKRLLIVDRDETLVSDKKGYTFELDDLKVLSGVKNGLTLSKSKGYVTAVVTNQSGISRGFFTRTHMEEFHRHMLQKLCDQTNLINLIIVCPHAPDLNGKSMCICRKPSSYMLECAIKYFHADPKQTVMIGDQESDLLAARLAGIRGVNVKTYRNFLDCCTNEL